MDVSPEHQYHKKQTRLKHYGFNAPSWIKINGVGIMENAPEGFEKQEAQEIEYWNPTEKGQQLRGTISKIVNGSFGTCYHIKDGEKVLGTPSHRMLQTLMENLQVDDNVCIEFGGEGEKKEGKNAVKLYEVVAKKS